MSSQKRWTRNMEEYLVSLMTASWTREEIAKKINDRFGTSLTKSAVTGKMHTMKGYDSAK